MSVRSYLELGLRLAVAGGPSALVRLLLIGSGIALGVGLLLSTLGVFPAEAAVERRQFARGFEVRDRPEKPPPSHHLVDWATTTFDDREIDVTFLAAVGRPEPAPWLPRILEPGELVVSPALQELLESPEGALLRPRFRGRIAATLEDQWLYHPGELAAYVGSRVADLGPDAEVVTGFGLEPEHRRVVGVPAFERPLFQVAFLVSVGLLIPILVFVVTGARLSASARESRMAAIRLVGGTPAQARAIAVGESLLASLLGCLLGVLLFFLVRPILARLAPPGDRWFPSDLAPPPTLFFGVLAAVVMISVGASLVSLRRVVITPLGVVRGGGKPVRAWWRWATLGTGLGGLFASMLFLKDDIARESGNDRLLIPLLIASYGLTAIGAATAAPIAGSTVARFLARVVSGPGITLGARRLAADPRTAGRTVGGIVIVVIAATITLLYTGVYTQALGESAFPSSLRATTVLVEPHSAEPLDVRRLEGVRGVVQVAPTWAGWTRHGNTVLVTDCDALDVSLVEDLPSCGPGDAFVNGRLYSGDRISRGELRIRLALAPELRVDLRVRNIHRFDVELGRSHQLLVPLDATDTDLAGEVAPSILYVATDGDPATIERIRNVLIGPNAPSIRPRGGIEDYADEVGVLVDAGVTFSIAITFAIAAATLLVTAVDAIGERRRSLATLSAVGTPTSVLRRALAVETALPMLSGVVLGLAAAIIGTWMVFRGMTAYEEMNPIPLPWRSLTYVPVFAVVATLVATIATFPSLGRAIRPDSLRTE